MKKLKYFSMFTGIGGFELGIEKAWEKTKGDIQDNAGGRDEKEKIRAGKPECVGCSEIDEYAIQVFEKRFPGIKNYGDAFKIEPDEIPDFDLLMGGFPCQAFSVAGKRRGFEDTRGTLFFEIARVCQAKRPAYLLLENVKGLLNHEDGQTFQIILAALADLGYVLQWEVLNSKNFGVPQNRERVFIVGHLGGEPRPEIFPIKEDGGEVEGVQPEADGRGPRVRPAGPQEGGDCEHGEVREPGRMGQPGRGVYGEKKRKDKLEFVGGFEGRDWVGDGKKNSRNYGEGERVYDEKGISPCLSAGKGGTSGKTSLIRIGNVYPSDGQHGMVYDEDGLSPALRKSSDSPKIEKRGYFTKGYADKIIGEGGLSATLRSQHSGGIRVMEDAVLNIRKLTPVECERLQGFPDGWTDTGISENQRYKCLGNAVTVNAVEAIMRRFFKWRTRSAGKKEAR